ncbi:alpha-(1,6)-fucosyltransferase-like isoform X2 [Liolophura sinensis]|uniref:alpha-(1,6)-fucosyltransferase-like isoform X2 n=1 Tax=Liolophura sinensis TaxID=3198878 RepID=UPI003159696D
MVKRETKSLLHMLADNSERAERQLVQAIGELDVLKSQNEELKKLAVELKDIKIASLAGAGNVEAVKEIQNKLDKASKNIFKMSNNVDSDESFQNDKSSAPNTKYEQGRRKVGTDAQEFWFYMKANLKKASSLASGNTKLVQKLNDMLSLGAAFDRTLSNDIKQLVKEDGFSGWRKAEAKQLGQLVQDRIHQLQNPKDCYSAKKLVCNLSKGCGYGCQLHHVAYCLIIALATDRTFILESKSWRYAPKGWETVFLPLSETCLDRSGQDTKMWSGSSNLKDVEVVELPILDSLHPRPDHLPLAVPKDLADRLTRIHGNPSVWWIGQIIKYLCRPVPKLQLDIEATKADLGFKKPIVGVHVRRTDKVGSEAAFHAIEEYMEFVEEYYDKLEQKQKVDKRRVYLASDDTTVLNDAKTKFPSYEFISDVTISKSAGLGTRYSDSSLRGIILDIHFLSISDYLVCTFSSQVCRVAYELMQTMHVDASANFHSLDDIFYFGGQNAHNVLAVEKHVPGGKDEIELEPGDLIGVAGNHWNGFSKGMNRRTGQNGLYPSYKVVEKLEVADFPKFKVSEDS